MQSREIDDVVVSDLRRQLRGPVSARGDSRYDSAREIWNAAIDRHPAVVAECADEADIVAALRIGQEHALPVAVRGGGHSVAGMGTCDGGLVIALGSISHVTVLPEARLVRVGGGALLGAVDRVCQQHGLAVPAGVVSHTGAGGLALGGGFGWLTRRYGLTCDSLIGARVVTPAGEVLDVSESERPELLWGLRGGGGNFGVVTEFTFRAHPVPNFLPVALGVWSLDEARAVVQTYRAVMPQQPNDVKGTLFFVVADPSLGVPGAFVGEPVLVLVQPWIGADERAARASFSALRNAATPLVGEIAMTRWLDLQTREDAISGHGKGNYTKGGYLDAIDDELIEVMVESARQMPGDMCQLELIPHGGAQLNVAEADSAFADRDAPYSFNVFSRWSIENDEGARFIEWSRSTHAAMRPYARSGVYTNFFAADDGQDRVVAAFGREKYSRLAQLKAEYDPQNVLAFNQNILPAAVATPST